MGDDKRFALHFVVLFNADGSRYRTMMENVGMVTREAALAIGRVLGDLGKGVQHMRVAACGGVCTMCPVPAFP
jgi:hypothetical protein